MSRRIILVMLMSILSIFSGRADASAESDFWLWFQENEAEIFDFERDREAIFDRLGAAMHRVHPNVTFELGSIENGQREFVISADGIIDAIQKVESLYAAAPTLRRWVFIKFRPRRDPFDIEYAGTFVKADTVSVLPEPDGEKIGLTVIIPGYEQAARNTYLGIAFLLVDQALGEYDVMTRVGFIEVVGSAPDQARAVSLRDLPKAFDDLFVSR